MDMFGMRLATKTRGWRDEDFTAYGSYALAPVELDGVRITVNDKPAYVSLIAPYAIHFFAPPFTVNAGEAMTAVCTAYSSSPGPRSSRVCLDVMVARLSPAVQTLLELERVRAQNYVAAYFSDFETLAAEPGTIPNRTSRKARPGETIYVFGSGFGPTRPELSEGFAHLGEAPITSRLQVFASSDRLGDFPVEVKSATSLAGMLGMYQIALVVPGVSDPLVRLRFELEARLIRTR
jgi:uncharacterized protein (TIGR03437 family)